MTRSQAGADESPQPVVEPPAQKPPAIRKQDTSKKPPEPPVWPVRVADGLVLLGFLGLTFALGVFDLFDTDFWWHLRTGDIIRQTWRVPHTDWYTYTAADRPWIDLHWGFEVLLSWGYAHGGVVMLNLAKCVITTMAVAILILTRRRDWPFWAMVLAWLPAIFVLGGRMYVRPETLSLLYLTIYLAVIFRWNQLPWLAYLLPIVQVLWVNTQGLFVFGPLVLLFGLVDAALRSGAFSPERKRWWRTVGIATALIGLACFVNPYGIRGALFPIELSQTMRSPLFASKIAELTPIPMFIAQSGLSSLPLRLHLITIAISALSFLVPLVWGFLADRTHEEPTAASSKRRKRKRTKKMSEPVTHRWRLSTFRILLFFALSFLSLQATRNSHQFAAVVGAVTAWNVGEWVAAMRARKIERDERCSLFAALSRRGLALGAVSACIVAVLSGAYYTASAEGRTVGLGERPLWFAHDAIKLTAESGMPMHGMVFHNGLAALFDYHAGPERKVYSDARLEVIGPENFERYTVLVDDLRKNSPGWEAQVVKDGRPSVVVDHLQETNAEIAATFFNQPHWRCVWFDPMASVFLHENDVASAGVSPVDFRARHYLGELEGPKTVEELLASARALRFVATSLSNRRESDPAQTSSLVTLALKHARQAARVRSDSALAWRQAGQLELLRDPLSSGDPTKQSAAIARFQMPFDPVLDLHWIRATYDLVRAVELDASDFTANTYLAQVFVRRNMIEAAVPRVEAITQLNWTNPSQKVIQDSFRSNVASMRRSLGPEPKTTWDNQSELAQTIAGLLQRGRAKSAANLIERAHPRADARSWETADQLATLYLHLGMPTQARQVWSAVANVPRPAVRDARVAVTYLVEQELDDARRHYHRALEAEPKLFEALYGLAVLEQDDARASAALAAAERAAENAPSALARERAAAIADAARPFAERNR
jgi:tetratricopeptide (TPR) repeat protein